MTVLQLISTIIFFVMPGTIGAIYYLCQHLIERLPSRQVQRLEQFALMAVRRVEQCYPGSATKKTLAEAYITDLFNDFRLPAPPRGAIATAIEAAVYQLPKTNSKPGPTG